MRSAFISLEATKQLILGDKFSILLIDESQDTNKDLVDAFKLCYKISKAQTKMSIDPIYLAAQLWQHIGNKNSDSQNGWDNEKNVNNTSYISYTNPFKISSQGLSGNDCPYSRAIIFILKSGEWGKKDYPDLL